MSCGGFNSALSSAAYMRRWIGSALIQIMACRLFNAKLYLNPLRAIFFRGNINIYLHFVSFLHIDTTQVVEILPQLRQEPTYST